jgi:hypothetical protein
MPHWEVIHRATASNLLQLDVKHFADIERLAFIGDKSWEQGMDVFCKPFTAISTKAKRMRPGNGFRTA